MASGRLAAINPTSLTETVLYTAPANVYTVLTISILNNGSTPTTLDLSIVEASGDTPVNPTDYFEYKTELSAKAQYERTGVVVSNGQTIKILTSGGGVSAQVWGIETDL